MKRLPLLPLAAWLLSGLCLRAQAQNAVPVLPTPFSVDDQIFKHVTLRLDKAGIDEHIGVLTGLAGMDYIADATRFPQVSTPLSSEAEGNWGHMMQVMMVQRNLTRAFADERTFLLWSKPDLTLLARRILAGEGVKLIEPVPSGPELDTLLLDYFQRVHGWDGHTRDFEKKIKIAALPPDVRPRVIAFVQRRLLQDPRTPSHKAWLTDGTWERAQLWIAKEQGGQDRYLWLHAPGRTITDEQGNKRTEPGTSIQGIANLDHKFLNKWIPPLNDAEPVVAEFAAGEFKGAPTDVLSAAALSGEAVLDVKVSFEATRRPLDELMADVAKQSGVTLSALSLRTREALVSARARGMTLAAFMNALTRLYGVQWTKTGDKSYLMHPSGRGQVEQAMLRLGAPGYREGQGPYYGPDLGKEIAQHMAGGKISFSDLPEELQKKLRLWFEFGASRSVAEDQDALREAVVEGYELSVEKGGWPAMVPGLDFVPRLSIRNGHLSLVDFGLGAATLEENYKREREEKLKRANGNR